MVLISKTSLILQKFPIRSCADNIKCYDGSVELCQISTTPADRINPSPALGSTLSDDQYYNTIVDGPYPTSPSSSAARYDDNNEGVRDKTTVELGLCVAIPQGTCPAENNSNADTGHATWPAAQLNQLSRGTCAGGKIPKRNQSDLVRECIANPATKTFNLEPVYRIQRNINVPYKTYPTNIKCVDPPPQNP